MQNDPHAFLDAVLRAKARKSLLDFTTYTMPRYQPGWFHRRLAAELDRFLEDSIAGRNPRRIIVTAPRVGKSELVSRRFPAYALGKYPDLQILSGCHTAPFSQKLNRQVQRIMDDEAYRRVFPNVRIPAVGDRTGKRSADEVEVVGHRGLLRSVGSGQSPAGEGADVVLFDDIVRGIKDAYSPTVRDTAWDWFNADMLTRIEGQGGALVCMTRWHMDDPVGRILEAMESGFDKFEILHFPALAEEDDEFRKAGESIDENRWPQARFEQIRDNYRAAGRAHFWDALFQGHPTSAEGRVFKPASMPIVDELPAPIKRAVRGIDKGGTAGGGDWTALVLVAELEENPIADFAVVDVVRGQWELEERETMIAETAKRDGRAVRYELEQEPGSGGKDSALSTVRMLKRLGVSATARPATGSKEVRADPYAIQCNLGRVCVVRGPWNAPYLDELRDFPTGKHDDQIDGSALAFNALAKRVASWSDFYGADAA